MDSFNRIIEWIDEQIKQSITSIYCMECGMKVLKDEKCYFEIDPEIDLVWVTCMDCKEFIDRGYMDATH